MARRIATLLLPSLLTPGCAPSGEVVVVLDSTMRADSVEVVVVPDDGRPTPAPVGKTRSGMSSGEHGAQIRALEDSALMLEQRFRGMRDSLNAEVASLESMDRRSRAYALKYAEIRRRTLAAEQVRAQRDSARSRVTTLLVAAGIDTSRQDSSAARASAHPPPLSSRSSSSVQRHAVRDSTVTLSLPPGRWRIGVARPGAMPNASSMVTVSRGSADTVRLTGR